MTDDTQYPRVRSPIPAPRSEFAPKPSAKLSEVLRRADIREADEQEAAQMLDDANIISEPPPDNPAPQVVNEAPPQGSPPADQASASAVTNVGDRTARTLENYSEMVIANIDSLAAQLDNLRAFFKDDAEQVRERISRFMTNGQSVTGMLQSIGQEIDSLQKQRTELLQDHARKAT
jgi:hypothetical protein